MNAVQVPTIGRIVHYALSEQDAKRIEQLRWSLPTDNRGNTAEAGQVYPALIVRTWGETPESAVQLQVFLDGSDTYWATSRSHGDDPGQWIWPPRV
jgi:hypothetical protein